MAHYYVVLWERNKRVLIAFIVLFIVTYVPGAVLCLKVSVAYHSTFHLRFLSCETP